MVKLDKPVKSFRTLEIISSKFSVKKLWYIPPPPFPPPKKKKHTGKHGSYTEGGKQSLETIFEVIHILHSKDF